ncbi:MAG: hypothetical protein B7X00_01130, partial [Legionella sp. 21-45-4]
MPTFSACLFPHYASFTSKLNQLGEQLSLNIKKPTRHFLYVLYQRAPVQFNNFINELCAYSLYLDASHLDIVIEHLEFQQRLPADFTKLLRDNLPNLSALNAQLHELTMR